jgi:tRNA nucleotidyltransferase (CCA-adding enzyme)
MHDLGKGDTPAEEWPRHVGHEERGAELVRAFCQRLRAPNEYRDIGMLAARFHGHCHRVGELRAATLVDTFEAMDAFRKPQRVEQFVLACEADYRGRPGHEDRPYAQGDQFRRAFAAARGVDTTSIAAGASGPLVGQRIREARISAVKRVLSSAVQ